MQLDRSTFVDQAAALLRQEVLSGRKKAGAKLPPERQLAQDLDVGRATLRSALGRLVSERLLKTRQGSGYLVDDWRAHAGPEVIAHLMKALPKDARPPIIKDLLLVRRYLALALVERLIEVRADLTEARACVEALERADEEGADHARITELDLAVISALTRASGSLVLRLTLNSVATVLRGSSALQRAMFRDPAMNVSAYTLAFALIDDKAHDLSISARLAQILQLLENNDAGTLRAFIALDRS